MKLSTKTEYGIRALVHLAECGKGEAYPLHKIAKEESLPYSFLEKIFQELKTAGIVRSQRGISGGYCLAKPINDITIKQVIEVLEGDTCVFSGIASKEKTPQIHCRSHIMLAVLENKIQDSLNNVRLSDLVTNNQPI